MLSVLVSVGFGIRCTLVQFDALPYCFWTICSQAANAFRFQHLLRLVVDRTPITLHGNALKDAITGAYIVSRKNRQQLGDFRVERRKEGDRSFGESQGQAPHSWPSKRPEGKSPRDGI